MWIAIPWQQNPTEFESASADVPCLRCDGPTKKIMLSKVLGNMKEKLLLGFWRRCFGIKTYLNFFKIICFLFERVGFRVYFSTEENKYPAKGAWIPQLAFFLSAAMCGDDGLRIGWISTVLIWLQCWWSYSWVSLRLSFSSLAWYLSTRTGQDCVVQCM